jgi:hypothetical protein
MKIGSAAAVLILVASSNHLAHRELRAGTFEITGARGEDKFEIRNREAFRACPKGYESESAVRPNGPDGAWRWEIRCWISAKMLPDGSARSSN